MFETVISVGSKVEYDMDCFSIYSSCKYKSYFYKNNMKNAIMTIYEQKTKGILYK